MDAKAEAIRKKYLYRRLIMQRKVSLHHKAAAGLIGPDCAYHLYGQLKGGKAQGERGSTPDQVEPDTA